MIEHNGKKYARVTEVLSQESNLDGIDPAIIQNKARIGSNVHAAIHELIQGECPILDRDEILYFKSFKKWADHIRPVFVESEIRRYNEEKMLTGCIDAVIQLHGKDERIIVDYKTSSQVNSSYWSKQAHLYAFLLRGTCSQISDTYFFLKLDKYGELPQLVKFKYDANVHKECMQLIDKFWLDQNLILKKCQI